MTLFFRVKQVCHVERKRNISHLIQLVAEHFKRFFAAAQNDEVSYCQSLILTIMMSALFKRSPTDSMDESLIVPIT